MKKKSIISWIIKIVIISVTASMIFTLVSTEIIGNTGYVISFALLAIFIIIGILFDIIGISVTMATENPFHSMASRRERGAAEALKLLRNAEKVSSICLDIVGDVTGIVSGTTAAMITARLMVSFNTENVLFQILLLGLVTGLTIGGKAIGKTFAIGNSTAIVHRVGVLISLFNLKRKKA